MTHHRSQLPTLTARKSGTEASCLRSGMGSRLGWLMVTCMVPVGIGKQSSRLNRYEYPFM